MTSLFPCVQVRHGSDRLDRLAQPHIISQEHPFLVKDILNAEFLIAAEASCKTAQIRLKRVDPGGKLRWYIADRRRQRRGFSAYFFKKYIIFRTVLFKVSLCLITAYTRKIAPASCQPARPLIQG